MHRISCGLARNGWHWVLKAWPAAWFWPDGRQARGFTIRWLGFWVEFSDAGRGE